MNNDKTIKIMIDNYFHELVVINSTLEIFLSMKFNKDWTKISLISPTYFTLVRKSLLDDIVVSLSRLFEKSSRSDFNINKFCHTLRKSFNANSKVLNLIDDYEKYLTGLAIINNLLIWRDKAIAHIDKEYFGDANSLGQDAPLNIDDLKGLISTTFKFLNDIYYDFNHEIQTQLYYEYDDYKKLIYLVEKSK